MRPPMLEKLKQKLEETLPGTSYSNGKEAKCGFYMLWNIFDIVDD